MLIIIPISFASDLSQDNSSNEVGLNDAYQDSLKYSQSDISTVNGEDISVDNENLEIEEDAQDALGNSDSDTLSVYSDGINLDKSSFTIDEGENVTVSGLICFNDGENIWYDELNLQYSYVDSYNVTQIKTTVYGVSYWQDGIDFTLTGLKSNNSPYLITISVIEDDLYDEYLIYADPISPVVVTVNVLADVDPEPVMPSYVTFTPAGQIYVSDSEGNDTSNNGTEESPYATIQKALDQNKALGGSYEIIVKGGEYYFPERYEIYDNVRITGRGNVKIYNQGPSQIFFLNKAIIAEFDSLYLSNGMEAAISGSSTVNGLGEPCNDGKVLNIINCTFADNTGLVGAIVTYSNTTILQSTFIDNVATGFADEKWMGIINARDDANLTVNYCNFIDNQGKCIIYSNQKSNANFNFWGSNDGPTSDDISAKVKARTWIAVSPEIAYDEIVTGENYTVKLINKYTNESGIYNDLNVSMPDLKVNLIADMGNVTPSSVISDNVGTAIYRSSQRGDEKITVKLGDNQLSQIAFKVVAPVYDRIYVSTTGSDSGSGLISNPLRTIGAAIAKNKELGGDKTIIVLPGTYTEYDLAITDKITIIGQSKGDVIIDANGNGRILVVDGDADIYNITFNNGFIDIFDDYNGEGGAIYHNSGNLNIFGSIFYNNVALSGGAILSYGSLNDNLAIYNSTFNSNSISEYSSDFKGSAIFTQTKTIIENCEFLHNVADEGYGAVAIDSATNIINSRFNNNEAREGGAIYIDAGNQINVAIINNTFISNKASISGGAVYSSLARISKIEGNIFINNTASKGGAIYLYGKQTQNKVYSNNFTGNDVYLRSANVDVKNNTFENTTVAYNIDDGNISNVILTFLDNKAVKVKNGTIQLNATVTDDMGNLINGGVVLFTKDEASIGQANVVNGASSISHYFNDGDYLISGTYSASSDAYPPYEINPGLLRVNVKNSWFINGTGYELLTEAVEAAGINDVIYGIPGIYYQDTVQIGHRYRPSEPYTIYKNITITSLGDEPVVLRALGKNIFNIDYYSNVTFRNIVFTGANNPNGWGGAIHSMGKSTMVVDNCTFIDNYAEDGAAIHAWGNLYITNTDFINNEARVYGGAVFKDGDGNLLVENVRFINNIAFTYAGAFYSMGYSEINQTFRNVTFDGNTATCGGALFTAGKNVTFIDCTFTNNQALDKNSGYEPLGGAVYVHNGATRFVNVNFSNNFAEGTGGALQLDNAVTSIVNSTGRHITIHWAIIENCTIENNVALGDGGAFYTSAIRTHVNVTNSVIRNNTAANGALFVNLLGFYTLNNVTVENNKNTVGNLLVYTYGMYSFPESFYANTTIVNSTFKNNGANIVYALTEYATVNISGSSFEGEGSILGNDGAVAILTHNTQINPIGNYSVINNGNLSLEGNNFINPIYNTGDIHTQTFVIILGNETVYGDVGKPMKIYAVVVDDNNNNIVGGDLIFVVNNASIPATFENNQFVANYTVVSGNQTIDAAYVDVGLLNLTNKAGTIIGKPYVIIHAGDTQFNLTGRLNINLTDMNGNPMSSKLTVKINNVYYNITTDSQGVGFVDLDLAFGNYVAEISFKGNDDYNPASTAVNVTVYKLASSINPDVKNIFVGGDANINIILPDGATGTIITAINGNYYGSIVQNGFANVVISNLTANTYAITFKYSGDDRYYPSEKSSTFSVDKNPVLLKVTVNAIYGEDAVILVNLPKDATGNIIVTVDSKDYYSDISEGVASVSVPNLDLGNYTAYIDYSGDDKYFNSTYDEKFVVNKPIPSITVSTSQIYVGKTAVVTVTLPVDATGNVTIKSGSKYFTGTVQSGIAKISIPGLTVGLKTIAVVYSGDDNYNTTSAESTISVITKARLDKNKNVVMDYYDGSKYKVRALDQYGKPVGAGKIVKITLNGKTYSKKTDKYGYVTMKITLLPKTYYIVAKYAGYSVKNKVVVKQVLKSQNVNKKLTKIVKFSATLKTSKGKAIKNKVIKFKVNGKTFNVKTNSKGIATASFNNIKKTGRYTVTMTYLKTTIKKSLLIKK